jgi:hypothetical protein
MKLISRLQLNELEDTILNDLNKDCKDMLENFQGYDESILISHDDKRQAILKVFNQLRKLTEE